MNSTDINFAIDVLSHPQSGDESDISMALDIAIKSLKALEQEPRWIPVSESLPNLNDYTGTRVWQKKVLITGYLSFDDTKELFVSEVFAKDVICNSVHDTIVVSWMPLPKPYKEEE